MKAKIIVRKDKCSLIYWHLFYLNANEKNRNESKFSLKKINLLSYIEFLITLFENVQILLLVLDAYMYIVSLLMELLVINELYMSMYMHFFWSSAVRGIERILNLNSKVLQRKLNWENRKTKITSLVCWRQLIHSDEFT